MGRKAEPIKFRVFWGDQQIDKLTPEMQETVRQRMSESCSRYFAQHPEALKSLEGKDYVKITYFDAEGNVIRCT